MGTGSGRRTLTPSGGRAVSRVPAAPRMLPCIVAHIRRRRGTLDPREATSRLRSLPDPVGPLIGLCE
jgi:hypothetical protein